MAGALLDQLPGVPLWAVGDKGHSANTLRERIWRMGARPAIPHKSNKAPAQEQQGSGAVPRTVGPRSDIYVNRNVIERLWGRLKEPKDRKANGQAVATRAVATRYEKTAASFMGVLSLPAGDWIKH